MVCLLLLAFTRAAVALCRIRKGPSGSGSFLSCAIRMSPPFDAKKGRGSRHDLPELLLDLEKDLMTPEEIGATLPDLTCCITLPVTSSITRSTQPKGGTCTKRGTI